MTENRAILLLSGGLDSLAALIQYKKLYGGVIELALTFDYGQKAASKEIEVSKKICEYYKINHKIIKLDWLKDITKTSLVSADNVPSENLNTKESASEVWVPNRNAVLLNIAASFCDSFGYKYIIYGANKEEAETFPDNTSDFMSQISELFKTSTLVHPKVIAPLINCTKDDIVKIAVENSAPLEYVWSCYNSGEMHCGICESCMHLKNALIANHCTKYLDMLFKKYEN